MAEKKFNTHLIIIEKNGVNATVPSSSLAGWEKKGWKKREVKEPKKAVK